MKKRKVKILYVEDEFKYAVQMIAALEPEGFEVLHAKESTFAERIIQTEPIEAVLLDNELIGSPKQGIQILQWIQEYYPELPVVFISDKSNFSHVVNAIKFGAYDFIDRKDETEIVIAAIKRAVERYSRWQAREKELQQKLGIFDFSEKTGEYWKSVKHAAKHINPILIVGGEGSNRKSLADVIHQLKFGLDHPFQVCHCHTADSKAIASELFGKKEPSNSANNKPGGKISAAFYGTLYLDSIEQLSLENQSELLWALEAGYPIQWIAGTTSDLTVKVKQKKLLEAILKKFGDMIIRIPLISERIASSKEDFVQLCEALIDEICFHLELRRIEFDIEAWEVLYLYDWPRNEAELRDVLFVLCRVGHIRINANDVRNVILTVQRGSADTGSETDTNLKQLEAAKHEFYTEYFGKLLKICGKDWEKMEKITGKNRKAIKYLLKKYGFGDFGD